MFFAKDRPDWIERYYSQTFYPVFSYLSILLFSWVPFSVGDLLYLGVVIIMLLLLVRITMSLWKRIWQDGLKYGLQLVTLLCVLYTFFYINWGLNYFRLPVSEYLHLDIQGTHVDDYTEVLAKYIVMANRLREQLDLEHQPRLGVKMDLEKYIRKDTVFVSFLSQAQVHAKVPLSSKLISYFTVSGYFNPFTMEAHINQEIPNSLYPFVYVHELAHQMGVGFEDECNFIAFRMLVDHENRWYRYTAYYAAIKSLLKPFSKDKVQMERLRNMLSEKVRADFKEEYAFWKSKQGWIEHLTSLFYNQYLQHNNQPEGLARYDMMAKLIVAWEKQQRHKMSKEEKEKLYAPPTR
ncbi:MULTISPECIES: DUF3810 domain-containing protein [Sphingobacterium]|uniref:DUF3810 domain-containing protein n=1 Tax=Sphingobacterium TaxID=28453 RepID=UPI0013DAFDF8|nr:MULTISPECIES: DUF3810 domain-containing protein [unclassified Sphingobacterium]